MRKIAVSLSKGGVGKTTTAVNLSAGLAREGSRVLLIDTDTQGQASRALGVQAGAGLADLITGKASPDQAILEARPQLFLLAGGRALTGISREIARTEIGGERLLSKSLRPLEGQYDYVILDSAPGRDSLSVNVLFYASEILSPVSMEILTLTGLLDFQRYVSDIQEYREDLEIKYILPTFYDKRVKKSEEILQMLKSHYGEKVCSPIRYSVRLSEAPGYGQDIYEYAPQSTGAEDYKSLVERIKNNGR